MIRRMSKKAMARYLRGGALDYQDLPSASPWMKEQRVYKRNLSRGLSDLAAYISRWIPVLVVIL